MAYKAEVKIELKKGILDAEGKTTAGALKMLGFEQVDNVKSVKVFQISLNSDSEEEAQEKVDEMCKRLLANPVINNYSISITEA
jgi:phosphoribosylformylglycinamidine synthase